MKRAIVLTVMLLAAGAGQARAENLRDLSERVRDLERIVERLQEQYEGGGYGRNWAEPIPIIWTCTVTGGKEIYYGNGETKGLAEREAMEACKAAADACRVKKCSDE